jgi:nicotinate-nucleotide pyrophosphorylase (carboxylating)
VATPYYFYYKGLELSMQLNKAQIDNIIELALAEDIIHNDVTSEALIPSDLHGKAFIQIKAEGVLAGIEVARRVFDIVDHSLKVQILINDGARVKNGDISATISGRVTSILKAERTALNFLQRLSGIATLTAKYIAATHGAAVCITDTRKTTPGLRMLEKYAVRQGGGKNHRFHLGDGVLIKDNHLTALRALGMSLKDIIARAKQNTTRGSKIEVEVKTAQEALAAVDAEADIIMLDNMNTDEILRVANLIPSRITLEASGGISLENLHSVAVTGVNIISIGALTHSPKALDISLDLEAQK